MSRTYKILIAIGSVVLLGLIIAVIFIITNQKQGISVPTPSGDNVTVRDFNQTALETREGTTYIESQDKYSYYFDNANSIFYITLYPENDSQAGEYRDLAEKAFMNELDLKREDACKLDVYLSIPFSSSPKLSGVNFGLSFCPDSIKFE